jgi:UDP-galactopyranose mutase
MTRRLDVVYPVFTVGYGSYVSSLLDYIMKDNDIYSIGRQGLFTYANMDHCIDMGLRIGRLFDNENTINKAEFISSYKDYLANEN